MAKPININQPQKTKAATPTACPRLYWPRCGDPDRLWEEPKISRHEKFPFRHLYDVACSVNAYIEHLVDEEFMKELCSSSHVIIIQKTFTAAHYTAMANIMKKYKDSGNLKTKKVVIISTKTLGGHHIGRKDGWHVIHNSKLFKHNGSDFHDRIVILDGKIWHFGATICGMHETPHAYSGPWVDTGSAFLSFIKEFAEI